MLKEFRAFVLRGNVVDLAVGVVIGAAFTAIVNSVVSGMLNPLIAVFGDTGLKELSFAIGTKTVVAGGVATTVPNEFAYGAVLDTMVQFVLIAAVVFFAVVKPLNHLVTRMKPESGAQPTMRPCPECLGDIPIAARRCRHCAIEVGA